VCLLLVAERRTSKEIARHLGISPHTVDQRIRLALKTLGVRDRLEASRLLLDYLETEQRSRAVLPWVTRRHPLNTMGARARLFWITVIAAGAAFVAGISLAALEAVAKMFDSR
jgi:hypothetical protein